MGRAFRGCDANFLAVGLGVAGVEGAFGGAEGGGDGDVIQKLAGFLVRAVGDCFGGIDGAAAADTDKSVDGGVLGDGVGGFVELGDGGVLFDVGERAGVMVFAEEGFDFFDERGFGGEGGAGYYEGFGGRGGEAGEEVLFDGGGAVVEALEVGWLPEAGEGVLGCFCHAGVWIF